MAILNKDKNEKLKIDLNTVQGNSFSLLKQARMFSKQLNKQAEELGIVPMYNVDKILSEMQEKDYEHLITVFDKYFGCVCDLER